MFSPCDQKVLVQLHSGTYKSVRGEGIEYDLDGNQGKGFGCDIGGPYIQYEAQESSPSSSSTILIKEVGKKRKAFSVSKKRLKDYLPLDNDDLAANKNESFQSPLKPKMSSSYNSLSMSAKKASTSLFLQTEPESSEHGTSPNYEEYRKIVLAKVGPEKRRKRHAVCLLQEELEINEQRQGRNQYQKEKDELYQQQIEKWRMLQELSR